MGLKAVSGQSGWCWEEDPHPFPTTRGSQSQVPWKGHSVGIKQKPVQLL